MNITVTGSSGRMGQAVQQAVSENPGAELAATHDVGEDLAAALAGADAVIDFTVHSFTRELVAAALEAGTKLVIGTTGHDAEELAAIHEAAKSLPIVHA